MRRNWAPRGATIPPAIERSQVPPKICVRDEAAGLPTRKDELAGQPQAVVPTEFRSERCAAERLGSNARLIPTIAFDWTVAPRTTVYITAPSPSETAVRTDYLAAALKGPRAVD